MKPFRDPILYPGEPMPTPVPGRWGRMRELAECRGGEVLLRGDIARWTGAEWECREHASAAGPDRRRAAA